MRVLHLLHITKGIQYQAVLCKSYDARAGAAQLLGLQLDLQVYCNFTYLTDVGRNFSNGTLVRRWGPYKRVKPK